MKLVYLSHYRPFALGRAQYSALPGSGTWCYGRDAVHFWKGLGGLR